MREREVTLRVSVGSAIALATERIVEPVEGMHRAISRPWFAALGSIGKPAQVLHDAISRVVYGSVRVGGAALGVGLDTWMTGAAGKGDAARALVNGLWGDALGRGARQLQTPMTVRNRQGEVVPIGPELAAAFPAATGRLVVLVHGLIETERCWDGADGEMGLIDALDAHPALTPVTVRYNTGLAAATNGNALAALLEAVHAGWPVPVESIALVGHSAGGVIIHDACVTARRRGYRWYDDASDVVTIGSPHHGAPLEKLVGAAAWGLTLAPQTRALADFLDRRSQGIKDLKTGTAGLGGQAPPRVAAGSPHIRYHFVAGVVTTDPAHPIGSLVGDLVVRPASSTAVPQVTPTNVVVLGGVHHFNLLDEPTAIETVMSWLAAE